MAGTLYGFPFDEELFYRNWRNAPDPVTTALVDSGVMVEDAEIATMIAGGSDLYSVPFYNVIGGEPVNYDGKTDITADDTDATYQTGVVFGRAKAWRARDFVVDYHKADPMGQIVSQVASYWAKQRQNQLINILGALFGVTKPSGSPENPEFYDQWALHTTDLSSASATVAEGNKLGATSIGDAAVKACGDLATGKFALAVMHSVVAQNLAGLQLLEFRKYTDPTGIERQLPIADINGKTVIVSDRVPYVAATDSSAAKYTTYVLGAGALRHADAPVMVPVETERDAKTNGGEEYLYTRKRETMLPNGFSYTKKSSDGPSPTDAMLGESARYNPVFDPKCLGFARIVSNG